MIISKKPPYADTDVHPDTTRIQIDKMLREYGVSGIRWETDFDLNKVSLEFGIETEIKGVRKRIGIKIEPPTFGANRKTWDPKQGKHIYVIAPNWAQSFRLLFYWLKTKLEAVAYGLNSVEKEFLSQVVMTLPSGVTTTLGEVAQEAIAGGRLQLMLPSGETHESTD